MFEPHQGGDDAILVCLDFGEIDFQDARDQQLL